MGDAFYVILQGAVHCTAHGKNINVTLTTGMSFGETALVTQARRCPLPPRACSVTL